MSADAQGAAGSAWRASRRHLGDMLAWLWPGWGYRRIRRGWQVEWARDDFTPFWLSHRIPREVQEGVASGWFPPGGSIVDIGCGSGEITAWLAEQGYNATGVDYAAAAIERARARFPDRAGSLEFVVLDVCRSPLPAVRFHGAVDRGCLSGLPEAEWSGYRRSLATGLVPGAAFLLLYAMFDRRGRASLRAATAEGALRAMFESQFRIERIESSVIDVCASAEPVPALAVWMHRTP